MPKFAANLSFLYTEVPFLERFAEAARDGFRAVEFLFPYEHPAELIATRMRAAGLQNVLFNAPPGDWARGERGLAAIPGREDAFRAGVIQALDYARILGTPRVHMLAGLVPPGGDRAAMRQTYLANLRFAAAEAVRSGRTIVIEPINPRDIPGYWLNCQSEALEIIDAVGAPNLKVQMDLYHCQIVEGDLAARIRANLSYVDHMQIAGVPERHEPDSGEVNYPFLFGLLDDLGYDGWIGCEYRPRAGTRAGLGWLGPWLHR